ncbi:MAG: His/Gly/Thr/Pro-type tRNA ligase C-terminal domain-containing protein [Candidatus Azotimanducaceae bacterium WSBS_2022_MAG_OTU7]
MGIPHRVVIGDRGLDKGVVEYVNRRDGENKDLNLDEVRALFS